MTEELYIDGEAVDLKPDAATTLNYKSNLLGDISKITSSNSQTIQCPKTPRNRKLFDNPGAPAYVSDKRYKRYSARLVRNGVEVVKVGYAVLLSAAEHYEIGLYWGVMANFQAWVDKAAKLNELAGTEALAWDKNITATSLSQLKSRGYGYAKYDCGVPDTDLVNIHPSATAWWILNKIAEQAKFTFEMPEKYETALRAMAIPCLSRNASTASNAADASYSIYPFLTNINGFWGFSITGNNGTDKHGVFDPDDSTKIRKVDNATKVKISIVNQSGTQLGMTLYSNSASGFPSRVYVRVTLYNDHDETTAQIAVSIGSSSVSSSTGMYAYQKTYYFADIQEELIWGKYDFLRMFPHNGTSVITGSRLGNTRLTITEDFENIIYPSLYPVPQNLPEITQIDFIKALCAMLGIFVVPDPTDANNLKFVSFDVLQANKEHAYDWSDKLVSSNEDEPKTTEFKVNDYCRNNYFKYKEDDTIATNGDGNLTIASEVLEKEKTVITLPFAASDGSKIPHYKLNDDGTVEEIRVKDRIMRLIYDGSGRALLTFDDMSFNILLLKYFKPLSRLLNSAIATTEAILLDEYELKSLDYTIPFYLRQYGKFYGIISIQSAAGKACEVKGVQLPETVIDEDEPTDPSLTTNLIGIREEPTKTYITAIYPLRSNVTVEYDEYLIGDPEPYPRSLVFPKGSTEIATGLKTRMYERTELKRLTPASDDIYNYIIERQTAESR